MLIDQPRVSLQKISRASVNNTANNIIIILKIKQFVCILWQLTFFFIHVHVAPTAEQIESERRRAEEAGREEQCIDDPMPDPEDPLNFHCVSECPDFGNHSRVGEEDGEKGNTCFGESNVYIHKCL